MKLAFITDMHFGYRRFEKDAYLQGKEAILAAAAEADLIILGGDNFDTPLPKMETIADVTEILLEAQKIYKNKGANYQPILAIHGNHDRRAKGYVNPTELLARGGFLENIHNKTVVLEIKGEKIAVSGMGNVPDDLARAALMQLSCKPVKGAFNVLVIHQSFQEFEGIPNDDYLTFEDLPKGYDLYLCGHTHKPNLTGKVLNPGSTVVTQLKKEETAKRGWLLYDTAKKEAIFREINSRQFIWRELQFSGATPQEICQAITQAVKETDTQANLLKLVLRGTVAEGFKMADLQLPNFGNNVFIENKLNTENLRQRIEDIKKKRGEKLGARELGMEILRKNLAKTKYNLYDSAELFAHLLEGSAFEKIRQKIENEQAG
ncbi:MAG: metallophosphoesterase family protein [Candidatus Micrarchaeota archaeon]|nr:metallophosphoesterase family protein [Candidatus Micrarchaeota archaeon]